MRKKTVGGKRKEKDEGKEKPESRSVTPSVDKQKLKGSSLILMNLQIQIKHLKFPINFTKIDTVTEM